MKFSPVLILFCIAFYSGYGQPDTAYLQGYFSNPLDTELVLKGSFGEIRPDHFHSGLDISTGEKEGLAVFAAADGYVSRIKISSGGFGKALYVTHPNGTVSVYAHLGSFNPDIGKFVRKAQYEKETWEIDFMPDPKKLKVKKGMLIAWTGNTGSSEGPHLHFEIRDEKSEEPINPLMFGIPVKDTLAPVLKSLRVFPMPLNGVVELTDAPNSYPLIYREGMYTVNLPDYIKVFGNIAFGIEAVDYANNGSSPLGVYSVSLMADNQLVYELKMDRFSFSESRAANACIDYAWRYEEGITVYRCFKLPGLPGLKPVKSVNENNGFLSLTDERSHYLVFRVADFAGNAAELKINIQSMKTYGMSRYNYPPADHIRLSPSQGAAIHKTNMNVVIPKNSVYDTYYLTLFEETASEPNLFSKIVSVGSPSEPLNASITVGLKAIRIPDSLKEKAVVVRLDYYDKFVSLGGEWTDDFLFAQTKQFGRFAIMTDTTPPVIKALSDTADSVIPSEFRFELRDDLSGIQAYRAVLNGRWLLMEYDSKNGLLKGEITADELKKLNASKQPIVLTITATDSRKNSTTYKKVFSK